MKITAREAIDYGIWQDVSDFHGLCPYALRNGMSDDTEFEISIEQLKDWI